MRQRHHRPVSASQARVGRLATGNRAARIAYPATDHLGNTATVRIKSKNQLAKLLLLYPDDRKAMVVWTEDGQKMADVVGYDDLDFIASERPRRE